MFCFFLSLWLQSPSVPESPTICFISSYILHMLDVELSRYIVCALWDKTDVKLQLVQWRQLIKTTKLPAKQWSESQREASSSRGKLQIIQVLCKVIAIMDLFPMVTLADSLMIKGIWLSTLSDMINRDEVAALLTLQVLALTLESCLNTSAWQGTAFWAAWKKKNKKNRQSIIMWI